MNASVMSAHGRADYQRRHLTSIVTVQTADRPVALTVALAVQSA
jgi:hypothetical protein